MKYLRLSILLIGFFFVENVSAQDYSSMPLVVQQKMDENKVNGQNVYNGIEAQFHVEILNLPSGSVASLISEFQNDSRIKSISIEDNGTLLIIVAEGNYTIKDVKSHIKTTSASIENYTENYDISQ